MISPPACCTRATVSLLRSVIAVDGEYTRAFFSEAHRRRAPVAPTGADAARARDDRDAVLQASAHDTAPVNRRAGAKL